MARVRVRVAVAILLAVAACGGPQVPTHNGYKANNTKPWKKPKVLAFDDKKEAKTEGNLSYPDFKRARWYAVDLPTNGELTYRLEITPPGDGTNEDFDLAAEVLSPQNRVISKADMEDNDAHELVKTHTLVDLPPGRYLIHLYLQSRLDTADYTLALSFKPVAAGPVHTDFPAQVAFPKPLPLVPLKDDAPLTYHPKEILVVHNTHKGTGKRPPPPPPPTPVATGPHSARILNMQAAGSGTQITLSVGAKAGATVGMSGSIPGVANSGFHLEACGDRTCSATVAGAPPDKVKNSSLSVNLGP